MHKKRNLAIAIVVGTTAGIFALQNVSAPSPVELPVSTFTLTSTATITISPTYEGCGYMWAYHDDPELSAKLNEAVGDLVPAASANAQLFGEDCVYADGHSTFSTMETDFFINIAVEDLTNQEALGNWIKQIMNIIILFPEDQIQGRKGFVEFSFTSKDSGPIYIHIEISNYPDSTNNMNGQELFQTFYTPAPPSVTPAPITPTATP
jgi:hypothetical protein